MKTILFIEDNPEIRDNTAEILELAKYRVLLAADGKAGVAMAQSEKPDLIICDIMMPELDGFGVIHLLQKDPATRSIPFIFLTAKAERSEQRMGMELGADDYITKPFSGTELLQAIDVRLKKGESLFAPSSGASEPTAGGEPEKGQSLHDLFTDSGEQRDYDKKERIYQEGHKAYRLYFVRSGKVKLYKTNDDGKELITAVCPVGEFFGYTALLEGVPYQESAEALECSTISSIPAESFEKLVNTNAAVLRQFVRTLAGYVHEKENHLLGLAYNSLRKKVAEALVMLHRTSVTPTEPHPVLQMSRDNLAAMAGTAKESLIRTLGDFRDEGLIDVKGTSIVVLREQQLADLLN